MFVLTAQELLSLQPPNLEAAEVRSVRCTVLMRSTRYAVCLRQHGWSANMVGKSVAPHVCK
jgi:hypothetical protein